MSKQSRTLLRLVECNCGFYVALEYYCRAVFLTLIHINDDDLLKITSPLVCPVHKFPLLQTEAALHSLCLYLAGGIFYQLTVTALDRWH